MPLDNANSMRDPIMDTPPPPLISYTTARRSATKKQLERTAKTPFQHHGNLQIKRFRSELQPNRISNRFHAHTNFKSSTRHQTSRSNPENSILTRLRVLNLAKEQNYQHVYAPEKEEVLQPSKSATQLNLAPAQDSIKYQVVVNGKTYKVLRKIGEGGSAKVYEGYEPQTSKTVAIKIINVGKGDERTRDSYFNEKDILLKLRDSRHVVRMHDWEFKADLKELVIVMEKGDADLAQVLDSHFQARGKTIDGIFIKFYWRGMVEAVNDIHKQGIVHADLKPVNFILVRNEIKLIDFGIANIMDPDLTSIIKDYQIGTINYMAPESLRNRATDCSIHQLNSFNKTGVADENSQHQRKTVIKYNSKADIWSLGCILYNLVYGRPPFDVYQDILSKAQAITNPRHIIQFPEISNRNLLNCMRSCLKYNPADRPTASELLTDSYLKEDIVILQQTTNTNTNIPQLMKPQIQLNQQHHPRT